MSKCRTFVIAFKKKKEFKQNFILQSCLWASPYHSGDVWHKFSKQNKEKEKNM